MTRFNCNWQTSNCAYSSSPVDIPQDIKLCEGSNKHQHGSPQDCCSITMVFGEVCIRNDFTEVCTDRSSYVHTVACIQALHGLLPAGTIQSCMELHVKHCVTAQALPALQHHSTCGNTATHGYMIKQTRRHQKQLLCVHAGNSKSSK